MPLVHRMKRSALADYREEQPRGGADAKGRGESHVTSLTDGPQTDTDTSKASDSQTRCGGAAYRMSYRKMCGTESKNDASVGSSEYQRVMVCRGYRHHDQANAKTLLIPVFLLDI